MVVGRGDDGSQVVVNSGFFQGRLGDDLQKLPVVEGRDPEAREDVRRLELSDVLLVKEGSDGAIKRSNDVERKKTNAYNFCSLHLRK